MRIRAILVLMYVLFCLKLSGQVNYFRQYGPSDGLGNLFIYSINQGKDGYLWIGTAEGLYRFDGFDFRHYTLQDSLAENFITTIFRDFSGDLWLGHMNGGITHIADGRFIKYNESPEINTAITSITESDTGTIWFSTQNQGLMVINKGGEITRVSVPVEDEIIFRLEHISGNLFLAGTQENLYVLEYQEKSSSMILKKKISGYSPSKVVEILKMKKGEYYIFSKDRGIYSLTVNDPLYKCNHIELTGFAEKYIDNIQGALCVKQNEVWVNTALKGIIKFRIDNSTGRLIPSGYINTDTGLKSDEVKCMFEDSEGNIWLGMYGDGLLRLVNSNLSFLNNFRTLGSDHIYALSKDSLSIWMATDNHIAKISPGTYQVNESNSFPRSLSGVRVNTLYCAKHGMIYLGFEKEGLYVFNPSTHEFTKIRLSNDLLENSIKHITGRENILWIGTRKGACKFNTTTGEIKWFNKGNGLPNNDIQDMYIDREGRVLVGTTCSAIQYIDANDKVRTLDNTSFGLNSVMAFTEDSNGSLWVATYGNGVFRFGKKGNLNYTTSSGLVSDYCYSLIFDNQNRILIGHKGGISQIDTETGKIRNYTYNEGIKINTDFYPNSILSDNRNNILFGTSDGLIILNSRPGTVRMEPPVLHIDAVYVNKTKIKIDKPVILKPGNYEIRIEYTGINLSNPDIVTYQTMLEGYSSGWSDLTSKRSVTYEKVGYGQYIFKIKAFNEDLTTSQEPLTVVFRIRKPVYLSVWFYLVIISLAVFALYEFIRIREKTMKSLQEKLLRNLDEKTKEIIVKEEIIKERQKTEKELRAAKERAELSDRLKTSFLANISHEIRTPMNAIVGSSELLKSQDNSEEEKRELLNLIVSNSNSLLDLIDDILEISLIESNQLKINFSRCEIYPVLVELHVKFIEEMKTSGKDHIDFRLSTESMPRDFSFETDELRLKQVLGKLIDNAIKFTESGSIILECRPVADKVLFSVVDTGIGMSEDKKQIVFDLFRKVEDDKLRLYRGTGLGLTLSQSLVKLMGGEIAVESELNKGSRFYFTLPLTYAD